jgi:threonine dehydrogenase-like Zn-dependent dehydrogenase
MRAAFVTGPERLEVRTTVRPPLTSGLVRLTVSACGICGSNLHAWRHPDLAISAEAIPEPGAAGHEIAAKVREVASGVTAWEPGDRVVVEPNLTGACRRCDPCKSGRYWFCRNRSATPVWGFSDEMVVPADCLFRIPHAVSDDVATLVEPLACAVHAVRQSTSALTGGGRIAGVGVAVLGAGVTGILAAVAARHHGAGHVAVLARYDHQAAAAEGAGADLVVRTEEPEHISVLRDLRPGLVIEAVGGSADTLGTALKIVAPGGEVAVLGLFDHPQEFDARRAVFRETRMSFPVTYGETSGRHDFEVALEIVASRVDMLERLASHHFNLDSIDLAFRTAADKLTGALRVVVTA